MAQQTLEDGQEVQVKGSSSTYTLARKGHVYSCTCPAWRNQGAVIDRRTCKHLRAYLGTAVEEARTGAAVPSAPVKVRKASAGADASGVATEEAEAEEGEVEEKAPPILLAHKWELEHDPTGWWMSEKLDGVRAYWDGEAFVSRLGNKFYAPDWFTADLPADTLDGELWVGRKMFSKTISIVRSGSGGELWKDVTYVVFDAPNARGGFEERIAHVEKVLTRAEAPHARLLEHVVCDGFDHLREELERVEALGGEGLMLRQPKSTYEVGRSTSLLKVKTFHDAEGRIVAHVPGAGKHKGKLGSVTCELPNGITFNIGTGFSDAERREPPPVGSVVTFRYQELTDDGIPRFPSWVGVRIDAEWPPKSEVRRVSHDSGQGKGRASRTAAAKLVEDKAAAAAAAASAVKAEEKAGKAAAKPAAAKPAAAEPAGAKPAAAAPPAPSAAASSAAAAAAASISLVHPEGKFWQIEVQGTTHITRFGKVGTPGQNRISELGSAEAAKADAEKRAQQKRREGYAAK
jgi:DNA ligase 1